MFTIVTERFVDERGFPFDLECSAPTRERFSKEMAGRYRRMLEVHFIEHNLVEA